MRRLLATLLTAGLLAAPAFAGQFFVGFDIGSGDLDIDGEIAPGFDLSLGADNVVIGHLAGGYEFDSGLFIAGGYEEFDSVQLFGFSDDVEITAFKVGIGYAVPAADRFRVFGQLGLNRWDLKARESIVFNPGPEETANTDGSDLYIEIGGEFAINDAFRLNLIYNHNNYDIGDSSVFRFGFRYFVE